MWQQDAVPDIATMAVTLFAFRKTSVSWRQRNICSMASKNFPHWETLYVITSATLSINITFLKQISICFYRTLMPILFLVILINPFSAKLPQISFFLSFLRFPRFSEKLLTRKPWQLGKIFVKPFRMLMQKGLWKTQIV